MTLKGYSVYDYMAICNNMDGLESHYADNLPEQFPLIGHLDSHQLFSFINNVMNIY